MDWARSRGVFPVVNCIAIDAVVPIVHVANPVDNLTAEELNLIYQGKTKNWKDLGGPKKRILVMSRDVNSGTYDIWEEKILHKAKITPNVQLQASNDTVVHAVSRNRYAIGYISIAYLNKTVKALKVNGIGASERTAISGEYPVSRPLFMITNGEPSALAGDFIKFLLSSEGQKIVKEEGFVPLR